MPTERSRTRRAPKSGTARAAPSGALAILKFIALKGGSSAPVVLTSREIGEAVGLSQQAADRHLVLLEAEGFLVRAMAMRRQRLQVSEKGLARLRKEHAEYRRLFEGPAVLEFHGTVRSGLGEGRYYLSLPGYAKQWAPRLGYDPFPGTLNLGIPPEALGPIASVRHWNGIRIDGFEADGRTFGGATCFTATVEGRSCHVIVPDRTHHQDVVELIAPEKLRDALKVRDGDRVRLVIRESGT